MNEYIVVLKQSAGCDYTIGCGIRVETIRAEDWPSAVRQAEQIVAGYTDEQALSSADLYAVSHQAPVNVAAVYARLNAEEDKRSRESEEAQERRQLDALKAKYGG